MFILRSKLSRTCPNVLKWPLQKNVGIVQRISNFVANRMGGSANDRQLPPDTTMAAGGNAPLPRLPMIIPCTDCHRLESQGRSYRDDVSFAAAAWEQPAFWTDAAVGAGAPPPPRGSASVSGAGRVSSLSCAFEAGGRRSILLE